MAELQDKFAFVYTLVPLAVAAGLMGDQAWVARIVGVRDAVTEQTGAMAVDPVMQDVCARTEREARARLGSDRWANAYAAGRRTTIEGLLKDIDKAMVRDRHPSRAGLHGNRKQSIRLDKSVHRRFGQPGTGEGFGHPGLFVADGSLYPRSSGIAPRMTIAALATCIAAPCARSAHRSR